MLLKLNSASWSEEKSMEKEIADADPYWWQNNNNSSSSAVKVFLSALFDLIH